MVKIAHTANQERGILSKLFITMIISAPCPDVHHGKGFTNR